jgi:hypothetical protein
MDMGVVFNVDGNRYPFTVEEAWELRAHLPMSVPDLAGPSKVLQVLIEQVAKEADGVADPIPEANVFRTEEIALAVALDDWLHAVKADAFPDHASALRYALWVSALSSLAFRDVVLRYADGREEHARDVVITGDPFDHDGRRWSPQMWRSLIGIDPEIDGKQVIWLLCSEVT